MAATQAVDIWAIGALLFYLLVKEPIVPSNLDDDCASGDAMAMLRGWDEETTRAKLAKVDDLGARDLLSRLLVADPSQRLAHSLSDALEHVFFDPKNVEKQRALERTNILDRINARPPRPFQVKDFERLWPSSATSCWPRSSRCSKSTRSRVRATRPTSTARPAAGVPPRCTPEALLGALRLPLSLWTIEVELMLPIDAVPGKRCAVHHGASTVDVEVPKDMVVAS